MKIKSKILLPTEAIKTLNYIRYTFEMYSKAGNPNADILLKHLPSRETINKMWEIANIIENKQAGN